MMFRIASMFIASCLSLLLPAQVIAQGAPLNLTPPKAAVLPSAKPQNQKPALEQANSQEIIMRVNAYFNASHTMIGDFVQLSGNNTRLEGKLYLQRPGKMRFEYAKPATIEVVADGRSVAIRDTRLKTQDLYLLALTPLKFLTNDKIDISKDTKILDVRSEGNSASILVEDKATFGGTSRIKLIFDTTSFTLKQWAVTDPQGFQTIVSLFNADFTKKPDPALFKINEERLINTGN